MGSIYLIKVNSDNEVISFNEESNKAAVDYNGLGVLWVTDRSEPNDCLCWFVIGVEGDIAYIYSKSEEQLDDFYLSAAKRGALKFQVTKRYY